MPEALQEHLQGAKALSTTDLQTLATQQLVDAVERSASDDLLTGYHFTDGYRRIIVVEGLARGAMQLLFEVRSPLEPSYFLHPETLHTWAKMLILQRQRFLN